MLLCFPLLSYYYHSFLPDTGCVSCPHSRHFCNTSWVSYRSVQFWHWRALYHKTPSTLGPTASLRLSPLLLIDWAINQGSHDPLPVFHNLPQQLTEVWGTLMVTSLSYQKGWRWTTREKRYTGPGVWERRLGFLPPPHPRTPPSQHLQLSINLKAIQTRTLGIFMEASSHRHDPSSQFPAPPHFQENEGLGLKLSSFSLWLGDPAPILKLAGSPPKVTSLEQKALLSPRKFQRI